MEIQLYNILEEPKPWRLCLPGVRGMMDFLGPRKHLHGTVMIDTCPPIVQTPRMYTPRVSPNAARRPSSYDVLV